MRERENANLVRFGEEEEEEQVQEKLRSCKKEVAMQPDYKGPEVALVERIMQLQTLGADVFQASPSDDYPFFWGNLYGGQLMGQALAAACKTVDPPLQVHSFHSYFLRTGVDDVPIVYKVQRLRTGNTFATRWVSGIQKGKLIFSMCSSFQVESWEELRKTVNTDPRIPLEVRQKLADRKAMIMPLEVKFVEPVDPVVPKVMAPWQRVWIRSKGKLSDDQVLHSCVGAYLSDWTLLETALRPHGHLPGRDDMRILSVDHSMWFHRPFRADEWLLYVQSSPCASNARGLVFGHIYTQSGQLVMSSSQEGMLRRVNPEATQKSKL
ncbi:hypothetical protein BDL97_15G084400 [Sphagnum fallax]|nr:hypothetical protein BDL97_15G084400 [Sphagnum fallax]KAH8940345.1 hypothetical protein BDL97_15G084400 [Sphagnum fallax]